MAAEARIRANRLNAQHSTGPRTPTGKAVVAGNAVKHGLTGKRIGLIAGESEADYKRLRAEFYNEFSPYAAVDTMLMDRAVGLAWRLQRAARMHSQAFDTLLWDADCVEGVGPEVEDRSPEGIGGRPCETQASVPNAAEGTRNAPVDCPGVVACMREAEEHVNNVHLGRMAMVDFGGPCTLERILDYELRIERSLYKTLTELYRVQHNPLPSGEYGRRPYGEGRRRWRAPDGCRPPAFGMPRSGGDPAAATDFPHTAGGHAAAIDFPRTPGGRSAAIDLGCTGGGGSASVEPTQTGIDNPLYGAGGVSGGVHAGDEFVVKVGQERGDQECGAGDHGGVQAGDVHLFHADLGDGQDQGADDHAGDVAEAAGDAGASEDDGQNDLELQVHADRWDARAAGREHEDADDAGGDAGEHVGQAAEEGVLRGGLVGLLAGESPAEAGTLHEDHAQQQEGDGPIEQVGGG